MRRLVCISLFLLASGISAGASAEPMAYAVNGSDDLYLLDLATGSSTLVGDGTLGTDTEALSFNPSTGELYGLDDTDDALLLIDPQAGTSTVVGPLGFNVDEGALAISAAGLAIFSDEDGDTYEVNLITGAATFIGDSTINTDNLAFVGNRLFGVDRSSDELYEIDPSDASGTLIGSLGVATDSQHGLSYDDGAGVLYLGEGSGDIFTINPDTGVATFASSAGFGLAGLAIVPLATAQAVPLPGWWALALMLGLAGAWVGHRRPARR